MTYAGAVATPPGRPVVADAARCPQRSTAGPSMSLAPLAASEATSRQLPSSGATEPRQSAHSWRVDHPPDVLAQPFQFIGRPRGQHEPNVDAPVFPEILVRGSQSIR